MLWAIIFAAGVYIAVVYLPRAPRRVSWRRSIRKTLPVALFAVAMAGEGHWLLAGALALGAAGDFALSRAGERAFLAGMMAFALAHLAYLALFMAEGAAVGNLAWGGVAVLLVLGLSSELWLAPYVGALRWPVRGYVAVIVAMGLVALGLPAGMVWVKAGAVLFILSDFMLAIGTFRLPEGQRWRVRLSYAVWVTYILAQGALALGLAFGAA